MNGKLDSVEHFQNPVVTRNGTERLIEWHNATMCDDQGNVIGTISSGLDITEREEATRIIRESEDALRRAFDNAAIGMVWLNPDGSFKKTNESYCKITGYLEAEILEKSFQEITHPEDYEIGADIVKRILKGEIENAVIEKRYIRKDGNTIFCRLTTTLVLTSNNEPLHFSTQVEDITSQKLMHQELERLVDLRTEELKEAQSLLIQTEKLAVLGQLGAGIGHELRNPLAIIKSSAFFLNMAIENPTREIEETLRISPSNFKNHH